MKTTMMIMFILIFSVFGHTQNKVDELVKKYGENEITLYTTKGELIGKPVVIRNSDKLPHSIKISGNTTDSSKIAELFLTLFKDKEEEGYKLSESNPALKYDMSKRNIMYLISGNNIDGGLKVEYTKDQYLFKASASLIKNSSNSNKIVKTEVFQAGSMEHINHLNEELLEKHENKKQNIYEFEIEMIDIRRLGGKKATKFKF
ncbi:hypothetical protein [Thalassobellus suaedae]|uniref:Uncharacterized protein n=1 Tax=Thalassobellus suaedae TaxID=3074124 RepID=A0ABY9Y6G3_9FLAO|nr:hypothetical protein RHP49_06260 [Flavobacteriaceae bacterium HL-DH10]